MKRPNRNVEVFSMSAIDLFASGLGAFIVLSMLLFPSYLKTKRLEIQSDRTEATIEELEQRIVETKERAAAAELETEEAFAAIKRQKELIVEREELTALAKDGDKWEAELSSKIKGESTFALLGHRTTADSFVIAVDTSRALIYPKDYRQTMLTSVRRILESLGHKRPFSVISYRVEGPEQDPELRVVQWPDSGRLQLASSDNIDEALEFLAKEASDADGLAPVLDAVEMAVAGPADAIVLVTYTTPLWPPNTTDEAMLENIKSANGGRKEIHALAMGTAFDRLDFYRRGGGANDPRSAFIEFMQNLAGQNDGDFSAIVD